MPEAHHVIAKIAWARALVPASLTCSCGWVLTTPTNDELFAPYGVHVRSYPSVPRPAVSSWHLGRMAAQFDYEEVEERGWANE